MIDLGTIGAANIQEDISMIGQFGVGFYSAFVIADRVMVTSKHVDEDRGYEWEAIDRRCFSVRLSAFDLKIGTSVKLFVKETHEEFLQKKKILKLIKQLKRSVNYKIQVLVI
uniref:Heat shock protein 90 n=1 Tax=Panagrolaimus sp. JU765 TaxID=591449 RepID=A0AC34RKK6_9BILA